MSLIMCVIEKSLPCLVAVYIFIIVNWLLIYYFSVELFTFFFFFTAITALCTVQKEACDLRVLQNLPSILFIFWLCVFFK